MIYLTKDDILSFNENVILSYGGRYVVSDRNILNPGSLEYLVGIVNKVVFGRRICRTRYDVAAYYSYIIIKDHIFHDGCKRTGILAAYVFLTRNGTDLNASDDEIKQLALGIEANRLDKKGIANWFRRHRS